MYVHRRNGGPNAVNGTRRATASRIAQAAAVVNAYEEESSQELGPITRHHVTINHARQPEGTQFAMPTDNSTRQAQALDRMRAEVPVDEPPVKKIKIRLSTSWVEVDVDINSLRDALGLPRHNMLAQGIFHEYVHQPAAGEDHNNVFVLLLFNLIKSLRYVLNFGN